MSQINIDFSKYPLNLVVVNKSEKTINLDEVSYDQAKHTLMIAQHTTDTHMAEVSIEAIKRIINYYPELGI